MDGISPTTSGQGTSEEYQPFEGYQRISDYRIQTQEEAIVF